MDESQDNPGENEGGKKEEVRIAFQFHGYSPRRTRPHHVSARPQKNPAIVS
jgi:hypothetical protein